MKKVAVFIFLIISVVIVLLWPQHVAVQTSVLIKSPPYFVFSQINVPKYWRFWLPWMRSEKPPAEKNNGPPMGAAAGLSWDAGASNRSGEMRIETSEPNLFIKASLELENPKQVYKKSEFKFDYIDGKTKVIWTLENENNFYGILFKKTENDNLVRDLKEGLAALKVQCETQAPSPH